LISAFYGILGKKGLQDMMRKYNSLLPDNLNNYGGLPSELKSALVDFLKWLVYSNKNPR
jgi:hypothetical protein